MNAIYRTLGISKQAFHQRLDHFLAVEEEKEQLKVIARQVRHHHPMISAREMYRLIQPQLIGRDKFERFCFENGFRVRYPVNYQRTTDSSGVTRFDNLLEGLEVTRVNQVWVSDITYYRLVDRFYYLTFIMDLFTRKIVGHHGSSSLRTEHTTIPALNMAMNKRKGVNLTGLILHSDGGGQYYSKKFLLITSKAGIINSMCESVYENPHAERLNGIIKNQYVIPYQPASYQGLIKALSKAVRMYNEQKPHRALKGLTPIEFESRIQASQIPVESENNFPSYFPLSTRTQQKKTIVNELCLT
jgi:transposase InsO family protein